MSVDTGRLAFDDWLALCTLMADALEAVHMAGFVHGDVKTENFCVTLDAHGHYESVALVDYGAYCLPSQARGSARACYGTYEATHTHDGLWGTDACHACRLRWPCGEATR